MWHPHIDAKRHYNAYTDCDVNDHGDANDNRDAYTDRNAYSNRNTHGDLNSSPNYYAHRYVH
ncbi:MAG: hypothetical protein HY271_12365 [Deltaproteobacteria bacterium]|nr:hypothetical protein [Deltaproteobacteria bacterium]